MRKEDAIRLQEEYDKRVDRQRDELNSEVYRLLDTEGIASAARYFMLNSPWHNEKKQKERRAFLAKEPSAKISIDTNPLRSIIPFICFKCDLDSSVARGEAIMKSDIDWGLVVTDQKVGQEQQREFVEELRKQGFSAYTREERDILQEESKFGSSTEENSKQVPGYEQIIAFWTRDEIERKVQSKAVFLPEVEVYVAGFEIE